MIKIFPDADEDDSLIVKKSFDKEPKDEKEFEDFAAPFSRIEEEKEAEPQKDSSAIAEPPLDESADEPHGAIIFPPENETEIETPFESLPPEIRKANEDNFWKGKIEALKNENFDQTDDSQADEFQTLVEPSNETVNFTLPFRDAPVNFESPAENETVNSQPPVAETRETNAGTPDETSGEKTKNDYPIFSNGAYQAETSDETIRKSGLAYAAAIVLFGSIVFTLVLGWFADLLLGTSPWGKVGGIILGAIIGFIQFFRTTSQILKDKN